MINSTHFVAVTNIGFECFGLHFTRVIALVKPTKYCVNRVLEPCDLCEIVNEALRCGSQLSKYRLKSELISVFPLGDLTRI